MPGLNFDTWVYPGGLEDGEPLDPPDEQLAAESLTEGATIEHAASAALEHDFLNCEGLIDPLLPADLVREYCVALREHGSGQPFRLFRGVVRVVVVVDQVEDLTETLRTQGAWDG